MNWKVPNMWEGGECWILGGGSSMPREFGIPEDIIQAVMNKQSPLSVYSPYLSPIHGKHVIGINVAYKIGTWMDMVFFGDSSFYEIHRQELSHYPKLKVSCAPKVETTFMNDGIKFLKKDSKIQGISTNPRTVAWNKNSGAAAISVAANAGAKRIILLGFDMTLNEGGEQHWHQEYKVKQTKTSLTTKQTFTIHMQGFNAISRDAKQRGIEIINASPNSKIQQFEKVSVKELLYI